MVAERKCSIEGCDKKHKGNTYCSKHNQKFKKYGDPLGEHPNETKRKQRKERLEKLDEILVAYEFDLGIPKYTKEFHDDSCQQYLELSRDQIE